jgi:DNA-binding beta-propeller fold protein YncE
MSVKRLQRWLSALAIVLVTSTVEAGLFYVDAGFQRIRHAELDGTNIVDVVPNTQFVGAALPNQLALDSVNDVLYWTELASEQIRAVDLTTSAITPIITSGMSAPQGIVVDPVGGYLYFSDSGFQRIRRSDLDGSNIVDIVPNTQFVGAAIPTQLALDSVNSMLYWVEAASEQIRAIDLVTSVITPIITSGMSGPKGIVVDPLDGYLYFADAGFQRIRRSDLDGTNIIDVVPNTQFVGAALPNALALDKAHNRLYWTELASEQIRAVDLTSLAITPIITSGMSAPMGIVVESAVPEPAGLTLALLASACVYGARRLRRGGHRRL